ncbi:hypothetical protein CDAR_398171 [Caerostris darwini]|uniref:Uncharacterized protein n=1 Tax=Caerostris darwini TaxID=1538125 RepID=A0AAV4WT08_9ARAC|nr:hypothetical protein CDAR_398171 [Caerostris darwini]
MQHHKKSFQGKSPESRRSLPPSDGKELLTFSESSRKHSLGAKAVVVIFISKLYYEELFLAYCPPRHFVSGASSDLDPSRPRGQRADVFFRFRGKHSSDVNKL